jgi:hypothetical protein
VGKYGEIFYQKNTDQKKGNQTAEREKYRYVRIRKICRKKEQRESKKALGEKERQRNMTMS